MSNTKVAFIWISLAAFLIFTSFAIFVGIVMIDAQQQSVIKLFFILLWLVSFLLQLEYFLLKSVYSGEGVTFYNMYNTVFLSSIYAFGIWITSLFMSN